MTALVGQGDQPHLLGDQRHVHRHHQDAVEERGKQDHVRHAGRLRR